MKNPDNKKCIECGKVFNRPSAARKHEREVCNPGKTCGTVAAQGIS